MLSTIVYILGDGVQYRFLRDLAELQIQRTATDELRQSMHIVCGMTEKTKQTENIFFSERVPQGMKLYFLNDLQTAAWLHQSVINIPEPDMIHVLLESPFRKKDWLERLRLLDRRAAAPVDAVLCDTQRAGLQTDTSSWKDDYQAGRQEIERLGIPVQSYVLQTVPEWLFTAVPVEMRIYRQKVRNFVEQLKQTVAADNSIGYIMYALEHQISITPDALKHDCYQRFDPSTAGKYPGDVIWSRAQKKFMSQDSELWKNIWNYYRMEMLRVPLLWEEDAEEKELHTALAKAFERYKPKGKIHMAANKEAYESLIKRPDVKSADILSCEKASDEFFSGIENNAVYTVMVDQIKRKISKLERIKNG